MKGIVFGLSAAFVAAVFACSSSSSNGGSFPTCQGSTATTGANSAACSSCVEGKCGSQLSSAEGACGSYFSCISGCQCSDLQCLSGCAMSISSACQTAGTSIGSCESSNCSSQCAAGTGTGSGTGTGTGTGTGSGTGGSGSCASLMTCCGMVPAADQSSCNMLVSTGVQSACASTLTGFMNAGLCH